MASAKESHDTLAPGRNLLEPRRFACMCAHLEGCHESCQHMHFGYALPEQPAHALGCPHPQIQEQVGDQHQQAVSQIAD